MASGVVFLASVHCDSIEHLESRPQLARLLHTGAFATAVLLEGRSHPGVAARVVALYVAAALYLFGAVLLAAAGAGGGTCLALRARRRWQDAHAFGRLLDYLHGAIRYRTLTAAKCCRKPPPTPNLPALAWRTATAWAGWSRPTPLSRRCGRNFAPTWKPWKAPRGDTACEMLCRMADLCRQAETGLRRQADAALRLYPRLGGCAGALAAILLL